MELLFYVTYQQIFAPKFGAVSERKTSVFSIPTKTDFMQFIKKHLNSDVIVHDIHRLFKKGIED